MSFHEVITQSDNVFGAILWQNPFLEAPARELKKMFIKVLLTINCQMKRWAIFFIIC